MVSLFSRLPFSASRSRTNRTKGQGENSLIALWRTSPRLGLHWPHAERRKIPQAFQLSVILRYIRLVGDPRSLLSGE